MKVGDRVVIMIPDRELTADTNVRQFNGITTTIVNARRNPKYGKWEFNLEGCCSSFGLYYIFTEEWLVPIEVRI